MKPEMRHSLTPGDMVRVQLNPWQYVGMIIAYPCELSDDDAQHSMSDMFSEKLIVHVLIGDTVKACRFWELEEA